MFLFRLYGFCSSAFGGIIGFQKGIKTTNDHIIPFINENTMDNKNIKPSVAIPMMVAGGTFGAGCGIIAGPIIPPYTIYKSMKNKNIFDNE
jgi:hypothetical protein